MCKFKMVYAHEFPSFIAETLEFVYAAFKIQFKTRWYSHSLRQNRPQQTLHYIDKHIHKHALVDKHRSTGSRKRGRKEDSTSRLHTRQRLTDRLIRLFGSEKSAQRNKASKKNYYLGESTTNAYQKQQQRHNLSKKRSS